MTYTFSAGRWAGSLELEYCSTLEKYVPERAEVNVPGRASERSAVASEEGYEKRFVSFPVRDSQSICVMRSLKREERDESVSRGAEFARGG